MSLKMGQKNNNRNSRFRGYQWTQLYVPEKCNLPISMQLLSIRHLKKNRLIQPLKPATAHRMAHGERMIPIKSLDDLRYGRKSKKSIQATNITRAKET